MNKQIPKKIVVIGGVAAGASFAARCRRLNEEAEITIIERGPDVSFANCGLPYHIGGEIADRNALAVQTPQTLQEMLNLNVRTDTEALEIDTRQKRVRCKDREGSESWLNYDALMLSPGAAPLKPPLPGIDDPRVLTLRNMEDMDRIKKRVTPGGRVVIVGAGFIGLEMAEQLHRNDMDVVVVDMEQQVLPQLDREMALLMESELLQKGIGLKLGNGLAGFRCEEDKVICDLSSGEAIEADFAILSIGVRPETKLARDAGIEVGARGHIVVDKYQRTSVDGLFAAGDAVETADRITGDACAVPLGGPANRQGRVAADYLFNRVKVRPYPGSQGTAIVRVFDVAAGLTGYTEKRLLAMQHPYRTTVVSDNHHAGYYPGAEPLTVKIVWDADTHKLLGAQVSGFEGVDKRIDVLATAIAGGMKVGQLCHLELAYAPPFGSAKDIINLAGFNATNEIDDLVTVVHALPMDPDVQLLDVRPKVLFDIESVDGSINIPFPMLRSRLDELDRGRPVTTLCALGKMSYFAARILKQNGFNVTSYSGGIMRSINPRTLSKPPVQ